MNDFIQKKIDPLQLTASQAVEYQKKLHKKFGEMLTSHNIYSHDKENLFSLMEEVHDEAYEAGKEEGNAERGAAESKMKEAYYQSGRESMRKEVLEAIPKDVTYFSEKIKCADNCNVIARAALFEWEERIKNL